MDKTIIAALISVIGTLGGVLIGSIISRRTSSETTKVSHQNTIDLMQRQEFNKAATEFQNAFLCEIIYLKHNARLPECERTYTTLYEFLRTGYIFRHLKAFNNFRGHLPTNERFAIDKAWAEYCNFDQYSDKNNEIKLKELALSRIEKILEFAKHK